MRSLFTMLLAILGVLAVPQRTRACAPAPPRGYDVSIVGEEAVIVWDAARRIEHFIRRADFSTEAEGFGFIVPTPTVPELVEVEATIFERLAYAIRPREEYRYETGGISPTCLLFATLSMRAGDKAAAGPPPVTVLHHQVVGGYDAVVLEASDPAALSKWLADNGYAEGDTLRAWAAPYIEKNWKFTAFKLAKPEGQGGLATSPVRMSFSTDAPFYPYREPADQRGGNAAKGDRSLRVFFVSDERYSGSLPGDAHWPAEAVYAGGVGVELFDGVVPEDSIPGAPYLTAYLDESSPRPGTDDVFFAASNDGDVTPEPIVHVVKQPVPLPVELLVPIIGVIWYVRRRRRRA